MTGGSVINWQCRDRVLCVTDRPLIMGILNVTPDSFSDGGRHLDQDRAVAHGLQMAQDGADILDVGGESTRPGAEAVPAEEELRRVIPVIRALAGRAPAILAVDTMKAEVARAAVDAGARIINDVSALTHDAAMAAVAAASGAGVILMHMLETPRTMQAAPHYADVVAEVAAHLAARVEAATAQGVPRACLAVDPGIGFGKTVAHNLRLLAHLDALGRLGLPVVVGVSRKSFLGRLTGAPVQERLAASVAALVFCVLHGAQVVRVHDVKESRQAVEVAQALLEARN